MPQTSYETTVAEQRSINRFSTLDNLPIRVVKLDTVTPHELSEVTGISSETAEKLISFYGRRNLRSVYELLELKGIKRDELERILRTSLFNEDTRLVITDVVPAEGLVMSHRPFSLRVFFAAAPSAAPILASVMVHWAGEAFVVEKVISSDDAQNGFVDIPFDEEQTLPIGPAVFHVNLFNKAGAQAKFRITCAVLPSNPFSLDLSPNTNFVTGTFSARAVRNGNEFDTAINVTLSNGDAIVVTLSPQFTWKFWDGGVGGSLVEQGTGNFNVPISVPAFGTWGGWIIFNSPSGSGIFNKYQGREDMTIEVIMTKADGSSVSGTITARTMFRFGLNSTKVAFEDFTSQELADLFNAVLVTRSIYERRDVSFDFDNRHINRADVGGFEVIDSESEARDLWDQWSGPDTNNNIDAFIVQLVAIPIPSGTADGIDGDIPGPNSHAGRSSGVLASKSGFVDAGGNRRLSVSYLGMLIGHEVGHYLGLQHTNEAGNLMLPSSSATDTNLNYNPQYRTIIRHGWVSID